MKPPSENINRLQSALRALTAYAHHNAVAGLPMRSDGMQSAITDLLTDLLTDLRHYCAASGEDFDKHLRRSAEHFNAEIAE